MWGQYRASIISIPHSRTRKSKYKSSLLTEIITPFLLIIFSSLHLTSKNPNNILIQPIVILSLLFLLSLKFIYIFIPKINYISSFLTLDLISSSLYILTIYLVILCYITSSNNIIKSVNRNSYSFLLWSLCFVLIICFCFKNIFWFYISFECALIPTILCEVT